jgi:hypothetical protein
MEFRFNADEWMRLSDTDRAYRCKLLAHEASQLAMSSKGKVKREYLTLAENWLRLAEVIERESK